MNERPQCRPIDNTVLVGHGDVFQSLQLRLMVNECISWGKMRISGRLWRLDLAGHDILLASSVAYAGGSYVVGMKLAGFFCTPSAQPGLRICQVRQTTCTRADFEPLSSAFACRKPHPTCTLHLLIA
jgi:hypothetical protein